MSDEAKRTRMNVTQDAKGFVKIDVTAEYETPEETAKQLTTALKLYRETVEASGLKILAPEGPKTA